VGRKRSGGQGQRILQDHARCDALCRSGAGIPPGRRQPGAWPRCRANRVQFGQPVELRSGPQDGVVRSQGDAQRRCVPDRSERHADHAAHAQRCRLLHRQRRQGEGQGHRGGNRHPSAAGPVDSGQLLLHRRQADPEPEHRCDRHLGPEGRSHPLRAQDHGWRFGAVQSAAQRVALGLPAGRLQL
ncbi:hypothetical protein OY671_010063, partial [Metschnikowia pulcherrima]